MTHTKCGLFAAALLLILSACAFDSKGPDIAAYPDSKSALIVLDLQKDFTADSARMPVRKESVPSMIANINSLEHIFAASGRPIIYIRNVFSRSDIIANLIRHGAAVEGSTGVAYDERLEILQVAQFSKSVPDMFSNRDLEKYLVSHHVSRLFMTGVFADQCVYWSSKSALNRKYSVTIISDAVAAGNKNAADSAMKRLQHLGARTQTAEEAARD